jgi:hypothetical protein
MPPSLLPPALPVALDEEFCPARTRTLSAPAAELVSAFRACVASFAPGAQADHSTAHDVTNSQTLRIDLSKNSDSAANKQSRFRAPDHRYPHRASDAIANERDRFGFVESL